MSEIDREELAREAAQQRKRERSVCPECQFTGGTHATGCPESTDAMTDASQCQTEDDCPTPMWCRGKDKCPKAALGNYRVRVTRLTIVPAGEPIFSEQATHVEIDDEAAGEFVRVTQQPGSTEDPDSRAIRIEPTEWPAIRHAIEQLLPNADDEPRRKRT